MHLHFTTLCAAIAACQVSGSHAAPSRSIAKLLHPLPEVPTNKRHLRSNKHALDEEERGSALIDLNKTPDEAAKGIEEFMGITGEPSAEQHKLQEEEEAQSKLLKEQEENEAQLKLLKEQEENEAQLKLLKEQEEKEAELKLLKEQEAQAKLQDEFKKLNDWKKISASFESQLKKAGGEEFKKMKQGGTYIVKQNLDELLDGWDPTAKVHKSKSKSSTERLQDWLAERESPDKLFTVLGIHKAADRSANNLLISMNLERWNFVMQTFDETGRYNFEDKLKETLKAFCGNDDRATLFLKRLVILRGRTRRNQLKWLREMKDPKQAYKDMKVDDDKNRFIEDNLANWSKYVDAYNDLNLQSKKTLRSYYSDSDKALIEKIFRGRIRYPQMGPKKQMLDEILESWANKKPPISPAEVFDHFEKALKKGKELSTVEEGKELSTLEEGKELSTVKKDELILTVPLRGLKNYLEILNVGKQMGEKSKDEVEMEKLIKSLLHDDSRRKESDSIEKFFKLKDALWPKNPLKRKSESPSDYARDRQRPRGE